MLSPARKASDAGLTTRPGDELKRAGKKTGRLALGLGRLSLASSCKNFVTVACGMLHAPPSTSAFLSSEATE